tara:strand:- start:272 stop:781 length:510 start_codon:yes stop_codon:yes gene_type:complete
VLRVDDNFNVTQAIDATTKSVSSNLRNFTNTFETYLTNYIKGVAVNLGDGIDHSDFALPTFPFAFDLDAPEIPESNLNVRFDDVELFMELNMILAFGATYEINLYSTTTPIGIRIGQLLRLGVVAAVDLILSVESEGDINISSGFHIKLGNGTSFDIALFGDKISDMVL